MATTKKKTKSTAPVEETEIITPVELEPSVEQEKTSTETKLKPKQKFKVGDIAFISKDADADLNGFKLFPQYKKYTYTVEAYDQISDVYTLRRLNLSLKLKSSLILAPNERAHDQLNRMQF